MYATTITKDEINKMPLIQFDGKIIIATTPKTIAKALDEIKEESEVGFDTESKPAFRKGQFNHVALIQIATEDTCYLLRTAKWGIIPELKDFLENKSQLKVGLALDDDIKALQKRTPFEAGSFLDLNKYATQMGIQNIGVKSLTGIFIGRKVSKNQQTSNWENEHLTEQQQIYAATDAWICLRIYKVIREIERRQSNGR
jgi:ribonuclease D